MPRGVARFMILTRRPPMSHCCHARRWHVGDSPSSACNATTSGSCSTSLSSSNWTRSLGVNAFQQRTDAVHVGVGVAQATHEAAEDVEGSMGRQFARRSRLVGRHQEVPRQRLLAGQLDDVFIAVAVVAEDRRVPRRLGHGPR